MIKKIKYTLLGLAFILFLFSLKTGRDDLLIRKRIREIANRENSNIIKPDSVFIKKFRQVLLGSLPQASIKNRIFRYGDLKMAMRELWNSDGATFYMHKIIPDYNNTTLTFLGYFPEQHKRKYVTITLDSLNNCTLINLK